MWSFLLFLFCLGMLSGALFSAPIYGLSQRFRQVKPAFARGLDVVLALLSLLAFNLNLLFVLPVCFAGALGLRSREAHQQSLFFHITRILSSALLAFIFLTIAWLVLPSIFPEPYAALTSLSDHYLTMEVQVVCLWAGTFTGFAVAPIVLGSRTLSVRIKSPREMEDFRMRQGDRA